MHRNGRCSFAISFILSMSLVSFLPHRDHDTHDRLSKLVGRKIGDNRTMRRVEVEDRN
jgi:hypothetical protein